MNKVNSNPETTKGILHDISFMLNIEKVSLRPEHVEVDWYFPEMKECDTVKIDRDKYERWIEEHNETSFYAYWYENTCWQQRYADVKKYLMINPTYPPTTQAIPLVNELSKAV